MKNRFFIDFLEAHQELKREYIKSNHPLGSNCNSFTIKWIENNSKTIDPFISTLLKNNLTYEDVRKLYVISPSLHELWFFDIHFWHLIRAILYGRLGLKAVLTSRRNNTSIESMASSFLLRRILIIENMMGTDNALLSAKPLVLSSENLNLVAESVANFDMSKFDVLFSLIRGIVDLSKIDSLVKSWKTYSPCVINEGPIFDNPSGDNILEIVVRANTTKDKKQYLKENFDITEYYFREELF